MNGRPPDQQDAERTRSDCDPRGLQKQSPRWSCGEMTTILGLRPDGRGVRLFCSAGKRDHLRPSPSSLLHGWSIFATCDSDA